jgi:hypothetical protein
MLNEIQQEKLKRFMTDKVMSSAVYSVLESEFLKVSKDRDVQNLAARFLAIEVINNAWQELRKYEPEELKEKSNNNTNIGV